MALLEVYRRWSTSTAVSLSFEILSAWAKRADLDAEISGYSVQKQVL
jgi:hypothetical protein